MLRAGRRMGTGSGAALSTGLDSNRKSATRNLAAKLVSWGCEPKDVSWQGAVVKHKELANPTKINWRRSNNLFKLGLADIFVSIRARRGVPVVSV